MFIAPLHSAKPLPFRPRGLVRLIDFPDQKISILLHRDNCVAALCRQADMRPLSCGYGTSPFSVLTYV